MASPVQALRGLTVAQRSAWLAALDRELLLELSQTPAFFLREEQSEPANGDYYLWIMLTGRGWGKTYAASCLIHKWARDAAALQGGVIVMAGPSYMDVRHKMVEAQGVGILATANKRFTPTWSPANGRGILTWPNGVKGVCVSGSDPDAFRGWNIARLWAEELCSWQDPENAWKQGIAPALRKGQSVKAVVTATPIPLTFLEWLLKRKRTVVTRGATFANTTLPEAYLAQLRDQYVEGSELWQQEIEGRIIRDSPRALFKTEQIAKYRVTEIPPGVQLIRKVTGVDPGVSGDSADAQSDLKDDGNAECGIVTVAEGSDKNYYVLGDDSCSGNPMIWAPEVCRVAQGDGVDSVIGERNNGGQLVEMAIRSAAMGGYEIPFRSIWSSHGKLTRAEPVAHLYRRGKVRHVGLFTKLENQMTQWWPGCGRRSPDRLDALVFALAELAGLSSEPRAENTETVDAYGV